MEFCDARDDRNVFFALLGAAALVLKGRYSGSYRQAVHSYGGNIVASFAVTYVVALLPLPPRFGRLFTAGIALGVVERFEALNGFGVMTNTVDPVDFAANAVGIALAGLWNSRRAESAAAGDLNHTACTTNSAISC